MFIAAFAETDYDPDVRTGVSVYDMGGDISTVDLTITRKALRGFEVASVALSPDEARALSAWLLRGAERCEKVRTEASRALTGDTAATDPQVEAIASDDVLV